MNKTAKNTKDAKKFTADFIFLGVLGDLAFQFVRSFQFILLCIEHIRFSSPCPLCLRGYFDFADRR